jgi:hypothetical protein
LPLSDHEQRMLRQIERQLQHERGLARILRMPAGSREAARNARRAAVGFIAGLLLLSIVFSSYWVVGLVGFFIMLMSAVALVQSLRRLARDRWGQSVAEHDLRAGAEPMSGGGQRPGHPLGGKWWTGRGDRGHGGDEEGPGRG